MRERIQAAIDYIENHLAEELDVHTVAAQAYVSAFHFQRIFTSLCGMPLGEYIRRRRLTLAAHELQQHDHARIIDIALKYGYDSPDSFSRAFRRFHGVAPSLAGRPDATLQSFAPMKITLHQEAITMLEYRIAEKAPFTVMGYQRQFNSDTSYQEIPQWWTELFQAPCAVMGTFGVCIDSDGKLFDYLIADLYQPWKSVPEGCVTHEIPGSTWAVFPCTLGTLQDVNTRIWRDWLPACKTYQLAGKYNLEYYDTLNEDDPSASAVEIWVPVKPI